MDDTSQKVGWKASKALQVQHANHKAKQVMGK